MLRPWVGNVLERRGRRSLSVGRKHTITSWQRKAYYQHRTSWWALYAAHEETGFGKPNAVIAPHATSIKGYLWNAYARGNVGRKQGLTRLH